MVNQIMKKYNKKKNQIVELIYQKLAIFPLMIFFAILTVLYHIIGNNSFLFQRYHISIYIRIVIVIG